MKIMHVVGARPNFPKVAPLMAALAKDPQHFQQTLVHTGQHYDANMSRVFFEELEIPEPDEYLNVGSGSHAVQTAQIMLAFEPVVQRLQPDWVFVVGDVNSTVACSLVCSKLGVPVAHVEAGLRSFDRSMPEEINRLVTDQIADLLFTPSVDGNENLLREGIPAAKIHFVGNIMIDTLVQMLPRAHQRSTLRDLGLEPGKYVLVTLHRGFNVDNHQVLGEIMQALGEISRLAPVIFPVHPRTRKNIAMLPAAVQEQILGQVQLLEPQGYLDFMTLMDGAGLVLTDSGGIQEETTYLGVPCLTLRPNTERPVTITVGTNHLIPSTRQAILDAMGQVRLGERGAGRIPDLWDGHTSDRIAAILRKLP